MVYEFTRDESQDRYEGQTGRGGVETGAKQNQTPGQAPG
jgi:hypothetical protein